MALINWLELDERTGELRPNGKAWGEANQVERWECYEIVCGLQTSDEKIEELESEISELRDEIDELERELSAARDELEQTLQSERDIAFLLEEEVLEALPEGSKARIALQDAIVMLRFATM